MLSRLALLLSFLWALPALSAPSSDAFQNLASPFLEILAPESPIFQEKGPEPTWIERFLMRDSQRYDPDVIAEPTSEACRLDHLQESLRSSTNFQSTTDLLANYVQRCESEVQLPWINFWTNLRRTLLIRFQPLTFPYGRLVLLHLPGDLKVKGYLALKGDGRPRPLVIFRLGVFSESSEIRAEAFEFLQLFESSPFNVLVLESTTSRDFLRRNAVANIGGYDEGIQDYQIAKSLQNPAEPIAKLIQGLHLAAISMGGHGMFFAGLLDEWGQRQRQPAVFRSLLGLCPLVDLPATLHAHRADGISARVINNRIQQKLDGLTEKIPDLPVATLLTDLEAYLTQHYPGSKSWTADLPLPPEWRKHQTDYWWLNQFWRDFHDVRTPILIFATLQDPLVPFALNSGRLRDHTMDLGTTPVRVIALSEGVHCSLPGAYQWKALTLWQQSFLLSQSRDFVPTPQRRELRLNWGPSGSEPGSPIIEVRAADQPDQIRWIFRSRFDQRILGQLDVPFLSTGWAPAPIPVVQKTMERWAQQNLRWTQLPTEANGHNARLEWTE